jgi:NADPH-dependent F420 reductase
MIESDVMKIAIIGGTGKEGKGLALRLAKAGYYLLIGSRTILKAVNAAEEIRSQLTNKASVEGMSNEQAAQNCDIAILTIPYSAHRATIEGIRDFVLNKLIIDVTVPLIPPKISTVQMPQAGSAAQEAFLILGETVQLAAAFHNISHENLLGEELEFDCDVLVTGTSKAARQKTLELVKSAGFVGWDAGPIENSVVLEGLTSILIGINRKYGSTHAGIRITGVTREDGCLR